MTALRIRCCVPFCRRSTAAEKVAPFREWICSEHWRLVPTQLKRLRRRVKWRLRHGQRTATSALVEARSWQLCKKAAIERAGGVG